MSGLLIGGRLQTRYVMKYTSTSRIVNLVISSVIFAAFGALGCFFSFWVSPGFFVSLGDWSMKFNASYPWNLSMLLGGLGLSIAILAGYAIYLSIMALRGNNDDDVRKVFLTYVAMGYVIAFWCFLNAAVFYRVIGGNQFGFWIVVFIILMIGALIASNVPMTKMLEDKDPNIIQGIISASIAVASIGYLLNAAPTLFVTISQTGNYGRLIAQLATYSGLDLLVLCLSGGATFLFYKAHKDGKECKIAEILSPASIIAIGLGFMASSTFEYFYNGKRFASLNTVGFESSMSKLISADYVVMGYIVGSLLILAGAGLLVSLFLPEKKANKA